MTYRYQMSRRKGFRKPPGGIGCARPSRYSNPYRITREVSERGNSWWRILCPEGGYHVAQTERDAYRLAVDLFRTRILPRLDLEPLRGHPLGCFCPLTDDDREPWPCHVDSILSALR